MPSATSVKGGLLTVREAAAVLGVSEQTIRRYVRQGQLEGLRLGDFAGSSVRISTHALATFINIIPPNEETTAA
jgi:excisionase family DNA binding protein